MTLKVERKYKKKEGETKYHRTEIGFGAFTRSFKLPDGVDQEKINAKHENGILTLTIDKAEKDDKKKSSISANDDGDN